MFEKIALLAREVENGNLPLLEFRIKVGNMVKEAENKDLKEFVQMMDAFVKVK